MEPESLHICCLAETYIDYLCILKKAYFLQDCIVFHMKSLTKDWFRLDDLFVQKVLFFLGFTLSKKPKRLCSNLWIRRENLKTFPAQFIFGH